MGVVRTLSAAVSNSLSVSTEVGCAHVVRSDPLSRALSARLPRIEGAVSEPRRIGRGENL